jgi:hypothetical protein
VPGHLQIAVRAGQVRDQFLARQPLGETRGVRIDRQWRDMRRACQLELAGMQHIAVGQNEAEQVRAELDDLAGFLVKQRTGQKPAALGLASDAHLVIVQCELRRVQGHQKRRRAANALPLPVLNEPSSMNRSPLPAPRFEEWAEGGQVRDSWFCIFRGSISHFKLFPPVCSWLVPAARWTRPV